MRLEDLQTADGHVESIETARESTIVVLRDWQEKLWQLKFVNAIALEAFSPEGEELAGVSVEAPEALARRATEVTKDVDGPFQCYAFESAWSHHAVLRVVASSCEVTTLEATSPARRA